MIKKTNHFGSLFWDGLSHEKVKLTDIPKAQIFQGRYHCQWRNVLYFS